MKVDLATSPEELFMMIGEREFVIYRQGEEIKKLQEQVKALEERESKRG